MTHPKAANWLLAIGLAAALFTVALHVSWLHEPFDLSQGGLIGGDSVAFTMKAWDTHGAYDMRFKPTNFFLPTTTEGYLDYLNHPARTSC